MANIIQIDDISRPELEVYARLTDSALRARWEGERGLMIAESPKVIACALDAGCVPLSLLMERRHIEGSAREIAERCGDIPLYTAQREVLASLTGYALTRGVLCAMLRPEEKNAEDICAGARRIAVLEGITDVTNVGAVFRSAAALGVEAVLLSPTCCDPLSRRGIRVSMGTVFQVPWARLGEHAADWPGKGMERLRAMGFRTAALALREDALTVDDPRLAREERLAVLLGTEGDGLARSTVADCDYTVRIPMYNGVDSLNVAAAGAVAFWALRPNEKQTGGTGND
jgi:tRNA G18 (ribose-2'-O)-methylase SpoU